MIYLMMSIEHRHDYRFRGQARTLAVLSGSGSRNSRHGMSDLTCMTKGVSMQRKSESTGSINKVASRRNGGQCVWLALRRVAFVLLAAAVFTAAGLAEVAESNGGNGNEHWVG